MQEQRHKHRHTHRHTHKEDSASTFLNNSLRAIQRRKLYAKVLYIVLSTLAIIMLALVFVAYFIDK